MSYFLRLLQAKIFNYVVGIPKKKKCDGVCGVFMQFYVV